MPNMTKRKLVTLISNETNLNQEKVLEVVQLTLDCIAESLAEGRTIELRKFGVFAVRFRKARVGRNPKKPKDDVAIPAGAVVKFKPSKELNGRVAGQSGQFTSERPDIVT